MATTCQNVKNKWCKFSWIWREEIMNILKTKKNEQIRSRSRFVSRITIISVLINHNCSSYGLAWHGNFAKLFHRKLYKSNYLIQSNLISTHLAPNNSVISWPVKKWNIAIKTLLHLVMVIASYQPTQWRIAKNKCHPATRIC